MVIRIRARLEGLTEVRRALKRLPANAERALKRRGYQLSYNLVRRQRTAARRHSRQAARAATTVRIDRSAGLLPTVSAGPHPLLYGSEFGAKRRFGWYAAARYGHSEPRQFSPHLGGGSYWFFKAAEDYRGKMTEEFGRAADDVIREWGA